MRIHMYPPFAALLLLLAHLSASVIATEGDAVQLPPYDFTPEAQQDLVKELPGVRSLGKRRMYSGYIPVEGQGRELFYWLVESDKGFAKAPVMLWTNGGPGCSGFLGFLTEQGPFRPTKRGHLEENKFAWTKMASMVFIEQPVGVGFSKGSKLETYNDANAARDNYRFIVNFFTRFPELRTNEFYISSESYGGHYMPTLAKELVDRGGVPNFKGFLVGNPLTSGQLRDVGEFMTFYGHQLLPETLYKQYQENECINKTYTDACLRLATEARRIVAGLDPYALDFPVCNVRAEKSMFLRKLGLLRTEDMPPLQEPLMSLIVDDSAGEEKAQEAMYNVEETAVQEAPQNAIPNVEKETVEEPATRLRYHKEDPAIASISRRRALQYFPPNYQPCTESYATSWLNRPDVRTALHVRPGAGVWSPCNNFINIVYNQSDVEASMVPIYQYLANKPIKIWIFSGDDDSVCPTWSEQQWIWKFPATTKWSPWSVQGQVAGYTARFKGFTFITVHGAGHMVPSTRPNEALELLKRFLKA